jgi:hypothetical protein
MNISAARWPDRVTTCCTILFEQDTRGGLNDYATATSETHRHWHQRRRSFVHSGRWAVSGGTHDDRNSNLWRTLGANTSVNAPDSITEHRGVLPPSGGTVLRIIDIPPEHKDPEERRKQTAAVFASMFPDATQHQQSLDKHPGMHLTDTVDYAILLQGELWAIMDEGETLMRAGDVLIQRGTNHAWANRSDSIARIAFILIDGKCQGA